MEGNLMVKDFILLCSESLNSYEEHLKCWTVKMSMNWTFNQSVDRIEAVVDEIPMPRDMAIREYVEEFQREDLPPSPPLQQQNEDESTVDYKVHLPASSETNNQSSEIHGFCMVCLTTDHERKYLIVPCGHTWVCQNCRDQDLKICPYCRDEIQLFVRVLETSI
jgi:hypothetical protein